MRKIILFLALLFPAARSAAGTCELRSPDGRLTVTVDLADRITYSVYGLDTPLMLNNTIALHVNGRMLGEHPRLIASRTTAVDTWFEPAVAYKFARIRDCYNGLELEFEGGWAVEFRAYDDGIVYRFITSFAGEVEVDQEEMSINFPGDYSAVVQLTGGFRTAYEEPYEVVATSGWGPEDRMAVLPALFDRGDGWKILVSESALTDYPCMFLRGTGSNGIRAVFPRRPLEFQQHGDRYMHPVREADHIALTGGTREFPWRYFVVTDRDDRLIETTMTARLAEKQAIEDASWIEPGQVSWEFWSFATAYGPDVDFVAGFNTETYKYYIDFAAAYGIHYIIMDEGWALTTGDPYTPNSNVDVHGIIRYGRERGVGVILWMTWLAVEQNFDLFERLSAWGVKGLKIDFMDRSDQWMVDYYERVAAEAARHRMVISFHGSFKPSGLEYKYPNVLTYEAVRGMENMGGCTPANSVWLPFIRNAAGPMDYTPGAMISMQPESYCGHRPNAAGVGTRAYQMALYVLFESGLQMVSDTPSLYYREPDCTQFITSVPVEWDETRSLNSVAGQYAVVAKHSGEVWYIGAINGGNDREGVELEIPLDFLADGRTYCMTSFEDGVNAFRQAMDYRMKDSAVRRGDTVTIRMARNGGWAAVLR